MLKIRLSSSRPTDMGRQHQFVGPDSGHPLVQVWPSGHLQQQCLERPLRESGRLGCELLNDRYRWERSLALRNQVTAASLKQSSLLLKLGLHQMLDFLVYSLLKQGKGLAL